MRKLLNIAILLLASAVHLSAEENKTGKEINFVYDVDFEMKFDNREFYRSRYSNSMTIFGARLTPAIGFEATDRNGASHRIMAGIDVMKDFGAQNTDPGSLIKEMTLYYRLEKKFGDTEMSMYAGIFPGRKMEGRYSQAFISDSLRFYDTNLDGLLLKFRRPKAYFEVSCDWIGQYGDGCRERFMVYSGGEGQIASILSVGYAGYMYHFANSRQVSGVVDNILIDPYARFDLGHLTGFQTLSFTLGYLQAFQHDRKNVGHYVFPGGVHLDMELRKWNASIRNMTYYGTDIMPYYNSHDSGGIKYGNELYFGDPFFRVHDDGKKGAGTYDRLEFNYEPAIGKFVTIKISAIFHFNNFSYSGFQQMVGVNVSF